MQIPHYIARPLYLNRILPFVGKDVMKVLVGQQRVGKSYMLFQLMDHIAQIDSAGQQIYINKELHEFADIRTSDDLIAYVDMHRLPDRKLYLYIQVAYLISTDEVHQREFGNLLAIPDNFPKFVLSMDEINGHSHEGIQHIHVEEFLFSKLWQL